MAGYKRKYVYAATVDGELMFNSVFTTYEAAYEFTTRTMFFADVDPEKVDVQIIKLELLD